MTILLLFLQKQKLGMTEPASMLFLSVPLLGGTHVAIVTAMPRALHALPWTRLLTYLLTNR